jgi:hypothetical protein
VEIDSTPIMLAQTSTEENNCISWTTVSANSSHSFGGGFQLEFIVILKIRRCI